MKTRPGFVANSSSSSFIIVIAAFPKGFDGNRDSALNVMATTPQLILDVSAHVLERVRARVESRGPDNLPGLKGAMTLKADLYIFYFDEEEGFTYDEIQKAFAGIPHETF
jgi:hypothetical protein